MRANRFQALLAMAMMVAAGICASAPVSAGPGPMAGGFGHDLWWLERMANELALSDTQQAQFERIVDGARQQAKPWVKQMFQQHKTMRTLLDGDSFDEAAVRAQATRANAAMTELAIIHARNAFEIRKILTPAQCDKMKEMHERHHSLQ